VFTRRDFILGSAGSIAFSAGCRRPKASGYSGFAFIANQEGEAVAAMDLTVFAVARHIRVQGRPTGILVHPRQPLVYALTPENGSLHELRSDTLTFARKATFATSALSMRLSPDGNNIFVLCRQPRALLRFSLGSFNVDWRAALPADPVDFELDRLGKYAAVSYGPRRILSLIEVGGSGAGLPIQATGHIGTVRFQSDSRTLIAANLSERMLSLYDVASRQLIVNLPLAVRPDHLCFNADGGQLFVTGEGGDGVVVAYPYFTPEVAETVLAGHAPGAMAASNQPGTSPQYLFVANSKSGDVSILNITKRKLVAVTPVGSDPSFITITPDDQYALVLNQASGDVAVIRIANITRAATDFKRSRKGPLFMMIPVGSKPVSAAVASI
jgi:YVTN family beta-propeller protein